MNCYICNKPLFYWHKGKKYEYKSNKIVICTLCAMNKSKQYEEDQELLKMMEEGVKYTEKQLLALEKLLEKYKLKE